MRFRASLVAAAGFLLVILAGPLLAQGDDRAAARQEQIEKEAIEALRKAEALLTAGKVLEGVEVLWRKAEQLPAGSVADALRFIAMRNRVLHYAKDAQELPAVERMVAEVLKRQGPDRREWLLLAVSGLYVRMAKYGEAAAVCKQILKEYPEPTDAELAELPNEAPMDVETVHPRTIVRREAEAMLDRLGLIGRPAPAVRLVDLQGRNLAPADYRGKVLLVDFWATDCPPCVEELPELIGLHARRRAAGLEILGLSADEDRDRLTAFVKARKVPWRQVFLGEAFEQVAAPFKVESVPAKILVGRGGRVRGMQLGGAVLEREIQLLLAEKAPD